MIVCHGTPAAAACVAADARSVRLNRSGGAHSTSMSPVDARAVSPANKNASDMTCSSGSDDSSFRSVTLKIRPSRCSDAPSAEPLAASGNR